MAVTFEEIRAPTFDYDLDGGVVGATRLLRLPNWDELDAFMEEIQSPTFSAGDTPVQGERAAFPGREHLLLSRVVVTPFDEDLPSEGDIYGVATCASGHKVELRYSTKQFGGPGMPSSPGGFEEIGPYMTHTIDGSVRMITIPHWGVEWVVNGKAGHKKLPEDIRPAVPEVIVEHTIDWHEVPNPPIDAIHATLGKLNDKIFLKHAIGTVLFQSYRLKKQFVAAPNDNKWELGYKFIARINHGDVYPPPAGAPTGLPLVTWNHFYRADPADTNGPWQVIVDKEGNPLLKEADFSQLFKAPPPPEPEE